MTRETGRRVGYFATGDPGAGRLVFLCHPTPGAASFDPDPLLTERWGVHLIALDRPGYGASDALPESPRPHVDDCVDDVAWFLDRAERNDHQDPIASFDRFGVIGWGTGGAVAAALVERFGERVDRLALVSVPSPRKLRKTARRALVAPQSFAALHIAGSDPDLTALGLENRLSRMIEEGYAQGKAGIEADRVMVASERWSERLGTINASSALFYGALDVVVEPADGLWYQRHLKHAALHVAEDSGPLVIAAQWRAILAHVAPEGGDDERN